MKKIPVSYILTASVVSCCLSAGAVWVSNSRTTSVTVKEETIAKEEEKCTYNTEVLKGYHYIQPVYRAEKECEPAYLLSLKSSIDNYVQAMKNNGLASASVYLHDLQNNNSMTYDGNERYHPGSMFKIVTMMTLFRTAATQPGFFDKKLTLSVDAPLPPVQTFNTETISPGKPYAVKELIRSMIVHSDNYATMLLHDVTDQTTFRQTFADLGLTPPDVHAPDYTLTPHEFSRFIDVLYDGRYLSLPASEMAISLLCESDFTKGIKKLLPPQLTVAHKFGESSKPGRQEMHETAIVYLENKPYLLTIMTRGTNSVMLSEVLSQISKLAYDQMLAASSQPNI
jgi:beta-lactamase class A